MFILKNTYLNKAGYEKVIEINFFSIVLKLKIKVHSAVRISFSLHKCFEYYVRVNKISKFLFIHYIFESVRRFYPIQNRYRRVCDMAVFAISAVVLLQSVVCVILLYGRERSVSEGLLLASFLFLFLSDRLFMVRKTATFLQTQILGFFVL